MNDVDKFQQRWEFRRKEADGDTSSDDSRLNSNGEPADKKRNLVTELVLLENDEPSDNPQRQTLDKQPAAKKVKSRKKKNVVPKKSKGCSVEKNKRKRNLKTEEMAMLKDLKVFADTLINELSVARENMFLHMREEMRKLVSKKEPIKKNVRCSQKNKVRRQTVVKAGVKSQNCPRGSKDKNAKSNVASDGACKFPKDVKNDQVLEVTTGKSDGGLRVSTTAQMNLANGSDQVISSSYLTLPTVLPNPQLQNLKNRTPGNDHDHDHIRIPPGLPTSNSGLGRNIGKLMDDKKNYQRFGNFSHIGQNCSQTESGSNISSLTYCENLFVDNNKIGPRMNGIARFHTGNPALLEQVSPYSMIGNIARKSDGEFVSVRPQELKDGQFYMTSLRNEQ
ncbi:hypothetical protein DH2020_005519 [Rehmannia glutinosa]|uniref:Uncharacterized protein n=1 Tax=Rehmannia glutinosa TaxID=99300 RepID=A0ABR0XG56_REHGL